jgi:hypothetical protein
MAKKLAGCLLLMIFSGQSQGLVTENFSDAQLDNIDLKEAVTIIEFADAVFECGVYYQYTAGGLKKNPGVPSDTIQFVSRNSQTLLQTADQLYQSTGISTQAKYQELMERAKVMLREQENNPDNDSDIIFEFGEKCRLLLISYPRRLGEISELLESN